MPRWKLHHKWDQKLGISYEVSGYIAHAIDSKGPSDNRIQMPEDFRKHTEERKIPRTKGKNFAIADLQANLHDRGRNRFVQIQDLEFLSGKGRDYVKAYYLHFILDYLDGKNMRDWMRNTDDSIEYCIDLYNKNKAVYISTETETALVEVIDFLKSNSQELQKDLNL